MRNGLARAAAVLLIAAGSLLATSTATQADAPMQGHYTGTWQSDGHYHFDVPYCTGLDLEISIDGTLDLTMGAGGQVAGTASGKVNAPINDCGRTDVSSGYGTISGNVTGTINGSGTQLVLTAPVIDMHWGLFTGPGSTVERFITMPDYTFLAGGNDCVSAQGTVSEQNFPDQWIVNDGTGGLSRVPGIGTANGDWQATSDAAPRFAALSKQIDDLIAQANVVLSAGDPTLATVQPQVIAPLRQLESTIGQDPQVSGCLLPRLQAWESTAAAALYARVSAGDTSIPGFRTAEDLLHVAASIDGAVPDGGKAALLAAAEQSSLDAAIQQGDWARASSLIRESLLWHGDAGRAPLQQKIDTDLHARLTSAGTASGLRELARLAYALGDNPDAGAAFKRINKLSKPKHGKKRTLRGVVGAGITRISGKTSGDGPVFSWQPVNGAAQYIVSVTSPDGPILWTWTGADTTVTYGDTAIEGVPGSADDGWSIPAPSRYTWTVVALDAEGKIVGIKLR